MAMDVPEWKAGIPMTYSLEEFRLMCPRAAAARDSGLCVGPDEGEEYEAGGDYSTFRDLGLGEWEETYHSEMGGTILIWDPSTEKWSEA